MKNAMTTLIIIVLAYGTAFGQTQADGKKARKGVSKDAGVPGRILKELDFLVGNWRTEMTQDGADVGTATHHRRWASGKSCIITTWQDNLKGAKHRSTGVSGWNAQKQAIVEHWYGSDGSYIGIAYPLKKMKGNVWEGTLRFVQADGVVSEGPCRLEKGDDQWVFTGQWEEDGEKVAIKNTTRKVGHESASSTATAEDFYEYAKYWNGHWKATYETSDPTIQKQLGGDDVVGDVSSEWSPTKRCQVVQVVINGKAARHAFWGFDPSTKRWRGMAFNSDGAWTEMTQGPEVLQAKFGKPFKTRVVGSQADGTRVVSEWVTTLIDQDHYAIKIYEKKGKKRELVLAIECERQK